MHRLHTALLTLSLSLPVAAQQVRPIDELSRGSLLICGGGGLSKEIYDRFVRLAGGEAARIVVIPTANSRAGDSKADFKKRFSDYGMLSLDVLHTKDRERADAPAFLAPLVKATGVWFIGGQQSRLSAAYQGTKVEAAVRAVVARGGIVGGSSAGAAIQSRVMIAGGRTEPKMGKGLDLLPGCIIDQHFTARKRLARLVQAVKLHPALVGFGIDEKTALWVQGRRLEVLGEGSVTVVIAASKHRPQRIEVLKAQAGRRGPDLLTLRRAARLRASGHDHAFEPKKPVVPSGTLILVGGGAVSKEVWRRFLAAAGGEKASIVVVPTAAGSARGAERIVRLLEGMAPIAVTVLHETDRAKIDDAEFLAPLREATGIWFGGGRQWRLVDAYEGTKALQLFHDVLKRGGVIGGSSAGTSIQGEFMARGNPLGNREVFIEGYEKGFGFFPGAAIDQHFSQRGRMPDLKRLMRTYPRLLGIGIDESTGIIVRRHRFEVVGPGRVFVCQNATWGELSAGQTYTMSPKSKKRGEHKRPVR